MRPRGAEGDRSQSRLMTKARANRAAVKPGRGTAARSSKPRVQGTEPSGVPGGTIIPLAEGRLYALANSYAVDGSVAWHDPAARGFAPMNSYVLLEGEEALVIDTGVTAHREALLQQLRAVVPPTAKISILHTRIGEFNSICNTPAVLRQFEVMRLYGCYRQVHIWLTFLPQDARASTATSDPFDGVAGEVLGNQHVLQLGSSGSRRIEAFMSSLRLLPTHWVYDAATKTLFTSDMFTHAVRPADGDSWVVSAAGDRMTIDDVTRHLLSTRYWWLPNARLDSIRRDVARVFATYDIEVIAPGYGCILSGRAVVKRHAEMLDAILAKMDVTNREPAL